MSTTAFDPIKYKQTTLAQWQTAAEKRERREHHSGKSEAEKDERLGRDEGEDVLDHGERRSPRGGHEEEEDDRGPVMRWRGFGVSRFRGHTHPEPSRPRNLATSITILPAAAPAR